MLLSMKSQLTLLFLGALFAAGCGKETAEPAPSPGGGMPSFFPTEALRLRGPKDLVLVEGKHGIELTLAEYNGRVRDERLPANLDTTTARQRYLEMLINYKVAAVEARLRGYVPSTPSTSVAEEQDLAGQILQESIVNATSIQDAAAQEYVRQHATKFGNPDESKLDDPGFLQHVKYTMQDERLQKQLHDWRRREEVVLHVDRLEELGWSGQTPNRVSKENES